MRRIIIAIAAVLLSVGAAAQDVAAPRLHVLDNGMRVITVEDSSNPVVSAVWTAHVGDSAEPLDFTGNSHFLEHLLLFRGTEKYPQNQIGEWAASRGGYFNGYTWHDYTAFVLMTATDDLDGILDRHEQMMFHGAFSGEDFETEKSAVFEELRSGQDTPYGYLWRAASYNMYPEETFYSRSTIGTIEAVQAATVERVREYYEGYYIPNNMTLAVVGDFNTEDLLLKIKERFGVYPAGDVEKVPYDVVSMKPGINLVTEEREVGKAYFLAAFEGPEARSPEWFPYMVLTEYLAGGKTSVLFSDLVTDKQLIDDIYMSAFPRRFAKGWQAISAETEAAEVVPAVDALWQQLLAAGKNGISESDLQQTKNRLLKTHWQYLDDVNEVAEQLAIADAHGDYGLFADFETRMNAVTAADVRAVAQKYLTQERFFLMSLFPPGEIPQDFDAQVVANAEALGSAGGAVQATQLASGVTLLHELKPGAAMESYTAAVRAGSRHGDEAGLAEAVANILVRETGKYSKVELQNYLDENGFSLDASTFADASYITLQAPTGNADNAMALLVEVLTNPAFAEDEWASLQSEMIAAIDGGLDRPRDVVNDLTLRTVYAGTSYGRSMTDERAALQKFTAKDLRDFYEDYYKSDGIAVAYTGDASAADLSTGLEQLGRLQGRAKSAKPLGIEEIDGVTHAAHAMEGKQQTSLHIVWQTPDITSDDYILWRLAERAIGGDLAARLWKLRQEEGLAYSVWMYTLPSAEQPIAMVYMATAAEKRDAGIAAIHREVGKLQTGITQAELDRVKVSYLANLNRIDRTSARRTDRHAGWWVAGFDANYRKRLTDVITDSSLDEVNRVVREVLQPEDYVFVEAGAVGGSDD